VRSETEQLDLALERVKRPERNLYLACLTAAYDWLDTLPDGYTFTAGSLARLAALDCLDPAEPRVWGAVMRELRKQRRIVPTNRITTEGRSHGGVARIWEVRYRR